MGGKNRQQTTQTAPWAPSQPYLTGGMGAARSLVFDPPAPDGQTRRELRREMRRHNQPQQAAQPVIPGNPWATAGMAPTGGGSVDMPLRQGGFLGQTSWAPTDGMSSGARPYVPERGQVIDRALGMAEADFDPSRYELATSSVSDLLNDRDVSRQFDEGYSQLRNKMDSQFAMAGRYGSDAHQNVMADAGADLMANLQDANAGRRLSAASQLAALEGAGTAAENQFIDRSLALGEYGNNWDYDQGMRRLQDYMSLIQGTGGMGGTSSTPQYRNGLAGALGGAATGASLASTLGAASLGPWAALGGIAGLL